MAIIRDFPKLESPYIRATQNGAYAVTEQINIGYDWCFDNPKAEITEKLDGTDVSIIVKESTVQSTFNRTQLIPFINKGKSWITEAILNSYERGYMDGFIKEDGQYFGEVVGPRVNGNPYKLEEHLWFPFDYYVREHLLYKSYHNHPKTFASIKEWMLKPIEEGGIFSLLMRKRGIVQKPEGIIFYNPATGVRAKLRLDMYSEWKGKRHKD